MRAGCAGECAAEVRRIGDNRAALASGFEERGDCLDLGAHAALREMTLLQVALGLREGNAIEPALLWLIEVDRHLPDSSRYDEQIRVQIVSEQRRGEVFVDHGLEPLQVSLCIFHHGDT